MTVEQGGILVEEIDYRNKVILDLWSMIRIRDAKPFQRSRESSGLRRVMLTLVFFMLVLRIGPERI